MGDPYFWCNAVFLSMTEHQKILKSKPKPKILMVNLLCCKILWIYLCLSISVSKTVSYCHQYIFLIVCIWPGVVLKLFLMFHNLNLTGYVKCVLTKNKKRWTFQQSQFFIFFFLMGNEAPVIDSKYVLKWQNCKIFTKLVPLQILYRNRYRRVKEGVLKNL